MLIEQLQPRVFLSATPPIPRPDHVVVVCEENHEKLTGSMFDKLAKGGASFTNHLATGHPSLRNYVALFSGDERGIKDDKFHSLTGVNLATQLAVAGKSFVGYREDGNEFKHEPWLLFADAKVFDKSWNQFPKDFAQLPSLAFVAPSAQHNAHDGTVKQANDWLSANFTAYANFCQNPVNKSQLWIWADEAEKQKSGKKNKCPLTIYGYGVKPGKTSENVNHYNDCATLSAEFGLPSLRANTKPIASCWTAPDTLPGGGGDDTGPGDGGGDTLPGGHFDHWGNAL